MRKIYVGFMLIATALFSSSVFANHLMDSKACAAIVDACKKAGYERGDNANKRFWHDCMRPVLMGETVKDVNIDPGLAKQCRTDKIDQLKKQLKDFEGVSGNKS